MSNIQRVSIPDLRFRTYEYDWANRQMNVAEEATAQRVTYKVVGVNESLTLPELVMLVTMRQSQELEDRLALAAENVAITNEILVTSTVVAEKLASFIRTDVNGPKLDPVNTKVEFFNNQRTMVQISLWDFMSSYLGLNLSTWGTAPWNSTVCEEVLNTLLNEIDALNRISDEKGIDMQSCMDMLTLACNYGINLNKMLLHNCRNLAANIGG